MLHYDWMDEKSQILFQTLAPPSLPLTLRCRCPNGAKDEDWRQVEARHYDLIRVLYYFLFLVL